MSEVIKLPTGEVVPVSEPPDVPGLKIVAWADMPTWAAEAFRAWHVGGQHPLGPYVHDFRAWERSLIPAVPVHIEDMNKAIARQGAKAGCYLEQTSPFFRWGKTAEVRFGNEDFDDATKKD